MERLPNSASAQSADSPVAVSESGVNGPIDYAGLRLITCAGTYDAAGHTYLDNVVVFAGLEGGLVADSQARSVDHHHKRFGRQAGARV